MRRVVSNNSDKIGVDNYLTFVALEDGFQASLSVNACEYCVDGNGLWKLLPAGELTEPVKIGQTVSFRANLVPVSGKGIGTFSATKEYNAKGNCMSLLYGDEAIAHDDVPASAFYSLFRDNTKLINAEGLKLPAIRLANACYCRMFHSCTRLIAVPELLAPSLAPSCYSYLFWLCYPVKHIKMMATDITATQCLLNWVGGVRSPGTFIKAKDVEIQSGDSGIPTGWTVIEE